MILIYADLHDHLVNLAVLADRLSSFRPSELWLAGDIGNPETYSEIARTFSVPIRAVAGNLEIDIGRNHYQELTRQFPHLSLSFSPVSFSFEKYQINLSHHESDNLQSKGSQWPAIHVSGHTHRPDLRQLAHGWAINPGTLSGWPFPATYTLLQLDEQPVFRLYRLEDKPQHM